MISSQKSRCQNKKNIIVFSIVVIFITIVIIILKDYNRLNMEEETYTGYQSGVIEQPQIYYNGSIYYYFGTELDRELPDNYKYVGSVLNVDNSKEPQNNFDAVQLHIGQKIYATLDKNVGSVYVEYGEEEYAIFSLKGDY